jgi:predicted HicB family RNase H-like nuclease
LFAGGCHGDDEVTVYRELCDIVEEWIEIFEKEGDPLPPPTVKDYRGRFVVRAKPELHKLAALAAAERHQSLNTFVSEALSAMAL